MSRLVDALAGGFDDLVAAGIGSSPAASTERASLIRSRRGQGAFREHLIRLWRGRCCVTGVSTRELLRASHIKPWRDSNNAERLDPFNGLLLAVNYDAAFDAGLISFRDDGQVMVRGQAWSDLGRLGIARDSTIQGLKPRHLEFLRYQRERSGW